MNVHGLVFAGVGSADSGGVARFLADVLAPDGRRFELLDRRRAPE